jgi:hypothetical protein
LIGSNHSSHASIVIKEYLNGKTLSQISSETGISKGKVHYLIGDWKNNVGVPKVEEARDFSVLVRKSGMSIKQCAQGFRILQILRNLGIGGVMVTSAMMMMIPPMKFTTSWLYCIRNAKVWGYLLLLCHLGFTICLIAILLTMMERTIVETIIMFQNLKMQWRNPSQIYLQMV